MYSHYKASTQEAAEEEEEASVGRPLFCSLSPELGPCNFNRRRFFFNATSNLCEEFTYGGCHGNENRFKNLMSCKKICNNNKQSIRQLKLTGGSFSSFEFGFGDWTIYKWNKIYYGSSEATEFSIDTPPLDESLGSKNELKCNRSETYFM